MSKSVRFLKGQITKAANRTIEQLREFDVYRLHEYLNDLDSDFSTLKDHFSEMEYSDQEEAGILAEFASYEEKFYAAKALLKQEIDHKLERNPNETLDAGRHADRTILELFEKQGDFFERCSTRLSNKKSELNMPKIKIPCFSGAYEEWAPFRNLFENVVGNSRELKDVEKLYYLRSSVRGEAASIIQHFKLIGENFDAAWRALVRRYEKPFKIICSVIDNVMRSEKVTDSRSNLRQTCATLNESIRILDSLGGYAQSRDPWIIKSFMSKLDNETVDHWARENACNDEPLLQDFLDFLDAECDSLEFKNPFIPKNEKKTVKSMNTLVGRCFVCMKDHKIFECGDFCKMKVSDREKLVKDKRRCINCFGTGHFMKNCHSKSSCSRCHRKHHSLLHREFAHISNTDPSGLTIAEPKASSEPSAPLVKINASTGPRNKAVLPTALVRLLTGSGEYIVCRALLDSGSQASFISENCFSKLFMKRSREKIPITAFSATSNFYSKGAAQITIVSARNDDKRYVMKLHILSKFISNLPDNVLEFENVSLIKSSFDLADPDFDKPKQIDLILGADIFFNVLESSKYYCPPDNLWIIDSSLGWLVSGGSDCLEVYDVKMNCIAVSELNEDLDKSLERFWKLEEPENDPGEDPDDSECEKLFTSSVSRNNEGRDSVGLPFKSLEVKLGESYHFALRRFLSLERRFDRDTTLRGKYFNLMEEFIAKGYVERVPATELDLLVHQRYYLPHYGICRKHDDSFSIRIVFDASMKCDNGISLNDVLFTGPNLQRDIFDILNNFRFPRYVFTADIVKMYRQIGINRSDRNFQRILWRSAKEGDIEHWRLTTVTDGESVSPYLALRMLKQLSIDEGKNHPLGSMCLSQNYMDDFIVGDDCRDTLLEKRKDLESILKTAGMELSKYASNERTVLSGVSNERILQSGVVQMSDIDFVKTLGVCWNPERDFFSFQFSGLVTENMTKRTFLSLVARIYDPMGWLSPLTIKLKGMFQSTWTSKLGWDDQLTRELKTEWRSIADELSECAKVRVPRHLSLSGKVEVHGYCDASSIAYAAVIYVRSISEYSKPRVRLLTSKAKVAPIKIISIARMELCAAHLLARLLRRILPSFSEHNPRVFCWSDSTTVLAWLSATPRKWTTFVANRCSKIHELVPRTTWLYVRSALNPADVASRGMTPKDLMNYTIWWNGPELLHSNEELDKCDNFGTDLEKRKIFVSVSISDDWISSVIKRFSSYEKLRRVFAYVMRMRDIMMHRKSHESIELQTSNLDESVRCLMRLIQRAAFQLIIQRLERRERIPVDDPHYSLTPFLDESGLVRVGGRLANAPYAYDRRFPIILPKGHFINLLIDYVHQKFFHSGVRLTMSIIRSQIYVVRLKNLVKGRLSACVICKRYRAETFRPTIGPAPAHRFSCEKPFFDTGIDFAGPFLIRPFRSRGKLTVKSYVAVLVCLATRAVHLELVFGLDVESLVMSLKRFVARRGRCNILYSDNGRNFLGSSRILKEYNRSILKNIEDFELKNYLRENLMDWKFIPPYSPNFGGIWESVVKSFKFHLVRSVGQQMLTIEEFTTVLTQIEAILNSRPFTSLNEDPEDLQILTPSHLLTGLASVELPLISGCVSSVPNDDRKRFRNLNNIVRSFWTKWRHEYFNMLMRKHKWVTTDREPKIGELVLIKRSLDPPTFWRRGRIQKTFKGSDGVVRVVDLLTAGGIVRESTKNIVPLGLKSETSTGELC